jgi:hypothetical protein
MKTTKPVFVFFLFVLAGAMFTAGGVSVWAQTYTVSGTVTNVKQVAPVFLMMTNESGWMDDEAPDGRYFPWLFDPADPAAGSEFKLGSKAHEEVKAGMLEEGVPFVLEDVPPGVYAIRVFIDENGNDTLDMGFGGPVEPWGISKNFKPFGPPRFKRASFEVSGNVEGFTIEILE